MSVRSALLASAVMLVAGPALAADLPARVAPAPYVAAPIFTWTGFYVGLNAGAGWNNNGGSLSTNINTLNHPIYGGNGGGDDTGFTGGLQAGYNMQFGSFVAGLEADINYIDRNNGSSGVFPALGNTAGTDFRISRGDADNWFGTLRARMGFAFDRALIFGTGGLAFGGGRGDVSISQRNYAATGAPGFASISASGDDDNMGWTLGGGLEWAFTNSMSFKMEYMHVSLGDNNRTFTTVSGGTLNPAYVGGQTITVRNDNKFDIVRAGVNFRF